MEVTLIGLVLILIGTAMLVFGGLRSVFLLLLVSGLFGGSAAIQLPALGGSSIPPTQLALLFVYLRLLMPGGGYFSALPESLTNNFWLLIFTMFGVATAFISPRLFAGTIHVFPMSYQFSRGMFDTLPLHPTSQNITAAFYILGSFLAAVAAYVTCRFSDGSRTLVSAGIAIGWIHVIVGLAAVVTRNTPADVVFEFFRNANYAQLDDAYGSFVRIRGIFAETSSYTTFAFAFFVLNAELWYRSIRTRATGATAFALAAVLFFSTSSTAYFGLAVYLAFLTGRFLLFPFKGAMSKVRSLMFASGLLLFLVAILLAAIPSLPQAIYDMLTQMTVGTSDSTSAQQRMFWAMQGWHVFIESYGIGIGPGSFRSSSIVTAMLGSVGIFGCATFLLYLYNVLQPWRRSTFMATDDLESDLGGAFGTAAVLCLLPAAISAPDPQPGINFSVMAGAALAMRPRSFISTARQGTQRLVGKAAGVEAPASGRQQKLA